MTPNEIYDALQESCELVYTLMRVEEGTPVDDAFVKSHFGLLMIGPAGEALTVKADCDDRGFPNVVIEGFNSKGNRVELAPMCLFDSTIIHGETLDSRPETE